MNPLSNCQVCDGEMFWIICPTGGWWYHVDHPADDHDGEAELPINEEDW